MSQHVRAGGVGEGVGGAANSVSFTVLGLKEVTVNVSISPGQNEPFSITIFP